MMQGMPGGKENQAMRGLQAAAPEEAPPEEAGGGEADQIIAQVIELLSGPMDPQTKMMIAQKIMEVLGGGGQASQPLE